MPVEQEECSFCQPQQEQGSSMESLSTQDSMEKLLPPVWAPETSKRDNPAQTDVQGRCSDLLWPLALSLRHTVLTSWPLTRLADTVHNWQLLCSEPGSYGSTDLQLCSTSNTPFSKVPEEHWRTSLLNFCDVHLATSLPCYFANVSLHRVLFKHRRSKHILSNGGTVNLLTVWQAYPDLEEGPPSLHIYWQWWLSKMSHTWKELSKG